MRISSRSLLLKVQMYILSLWLLFVLLILASVDVRTFSNASFTWGICCASHNREYSFGNVLRNVGRVFHLLF